MNRLEGKTAAVTGAGRGIGVAEAKKFAEEGANVLATDVLDVGCIVEETTAAAGSANGMKVDVTSDKDLAAMVAKAECEFGTLDILMSNAGPFANLRPKPFLQIDKVMTVNARSSHQAINHQATTTAVPSMLRGGDGKICNIAPETFYYGPPELSHHTTSKGAVKASTRCHGRELGDKNIHVDAIAVELTESDSIRSHAGFDPVRAPTVQSCSIKREMMPEDLLGT